MSSKQTVFFATKNDLWPLMERIEQIEQIIYVEMGLFDVAESRTFQTFVDIPRVGLKQVGDSMALESRFMLVPANSIVEPRKVLQQNGLLKFAIDPKLNPEAVELTPGGVYVGNENAIIAGRVAYAIPSAFADTVFRLITTAMRSAFTKVGWVFVGREAESLAMSGTRLVRNIKLSRDHDLAVPK